MIVVQLPFFVEELHPTYSYMCSTPSCSDCICKLQHGSGPWWSQGVSTKTGGRTEPRRAPLYLRPPPPLCAQTLSPHTQNGVNIFQGRASLVNPLSCFQSLLHIRAAAGKKNQFQHFIFTSIPKVSLPEWFQKSGNQWTSLEQLKTQCNIFVSVWWCCCERRKPGTDFF